MKNIFALLTISVFPFLSIQSQTVVDYDGNVYNTVTIGSQTWMKENLKATHYSDGTSIPDIYAYNNDTNNVAIYGWLYAHSSATHNDTTTSTQGACPVGWHLPSRIEWETLVNYLGGVFGASGLMKESGTSHWMAPNTGATNSSNFTALPAGIKEPIFVGGNFTDLNTAATFWAASMLGVLRGEVTLRHDDTYVWFGNVDPLYASIRCVNDTLNIPNSINKINLQQPRIYPNPASNVLMVSNLNPKTTISIFNMLGTLIMTETLLDEKTVDISNIPYGIYFVTLENGSLKLTTKLVITK